MRSSFAALAICLAIPLTARAADVEILAGPMIGHVTDHSARFWLQLNLAGEIEIRVIDLQRNHAISAVSLGVDGPSPFICDVPLNGLEPDHSYSVEMKFEGQPLPLPGPQMVIRTAPAPGDPATFSIAFGSDLYTPVPPLDDPNNGLGTPKSGDAPIFKRITDLKPRAFFFLGDTGFLPEKLADFPPTHKPAYRFLWEMHARARREPDLQELFRTTPCYSIYNDRDFGTLDADRTFVYMPDSNLAFQRYWPNPDWGTPEHPGCYCTFTYGDVDFFLLDIRSYRDPPAKQTPANAQAIPPPNASPRKMLGDMQLQWLEDNLKASRATFKIIAAPCTLFDADGAGWSAFPAEQQAFQKWLGQSQISGLLALAGNQPAGELTRIDPKMPAVPGELHYPVYTLACSTLNDIPTSIRPAPPPPPANGLREVPGNTFGTLDFGGDRNHRFITLRLHDDTGKARLEQTLFVPQLQN